MDQLESLVDISRYYGSNPDYVIAGGGNTSCKDSDTLYIKASGISLADVGADGFVQMSRELLDLIEERSYPQDPVQREDQVKRDLQLAIINPEHLRPSVETSLHNLIDYAYVVHTHPTLVNAVLCAENGEKEVEERFGRDTLYLEYTDPGYTLFKKLQKQISAYALNFGSIPKIIFLQNHGVFVGANTTQEVKELYESIDTRIRNGKNLEFPKGETKAYSSKTASRVAQYYAERKLISKAYKSPLTDHFTAGRDRYQKISRPFTPDIIVYCKSNYLFLERGMREKDLINTLKEFEESHGYYPKVIIEEKGGLILVEEHEKALQTVWEVFSDMMKISYLSEQFGGPHFMTDEQIRFIDNWEVENYRRKVARV
jgi:rhamnose utilization protein RhaD (predicted bifunctional aldolase and dehydrogenase)